MNMTFKPESKAREVVEACADCDCCRPPMDPPCAVFAELYRLRDRERESGEPISPEALRLMVDLCNYCALCPCPNIRADLIEAKARFAARDGLGRSARLLQDVERGPHLRDVSVQMGRPLFEKIRELNPDVLVTECLSCRLQFQQHLPYPVRHPIEMIREVFPF